MIDFPTKSLDDELFALPSGARVAVVSLMGSLCPITLGHVRCFEEARRVLVDSLAATPAGRFDSCIGLISLNDDEYLASKFAGSDEKPLTLHERVELINIATVNFPWIHYTEAPLLDTRSSAATIDGLRARWPSLVFEHFNMNGSDDVLKYRKWGDACPNNRFITMLRPGSADVIAQELHEVGMPPEGTADFVVGPELPDISSTLARHLSRAGDRTSLLKLTHPKVADWLLKRDETASTRLNQCSTIVRGVES